MGSQNLNKHQSTINLINEYVDLLLKEQKTKEDIAVDIEQLQKDIARIKRKLTGGDYPYSYCEITFDGEYELDLPKYGAEEFKRVLKGRMFFDIIGGSEEGKYMYIQTNSFPDNFKIPSGSDPGQTVMCKRKEGKYVKIEVNSTYLNIAELQVFDENGKNVAKTGNYNYSDNFKTTSGLCRTTASGKQYAGYPGSMNKGEVSVGDCEKIFARKTEIREIIRGDKGNTSKSRYFR